MANRFAKYAIPSTGSGVIIQNPDAETDAAQKAAQLQRTQQENDQANATAAAITRKTNAEADTAEANAVIAKQKAEDARVTAALQSMGPTSQVHGEEYLRRYVPPDKWAIVRAYARGDLGSRAGGMSASMLPIIQDAMNYDPTASGANFPMRVKMQTQLADGNPNSIGGGLRSMEQMLLHGADVLHASQGLHNFHSGITAPLNYPRTAIMGIENDPALSTFNQAVKNYAPESQKAIAGAAGGEQERVSRAAGYAATMSPEAVAGALQSDARMAFQRMGAINDQYRRVMGRDITDALSPAAKAAYDEIMAGGYGEKGQPLHPIPGWAPISVPPAGGSDPNPASGRGSSPSPTFPGSSFNGGGGGVPISGTGPVPGTGADVAQAPATDALRRVDHPEMRALVASMINAGSDLGTINGALSRRGFPAVTPQQYTAVQKWMAAHPGVQYPASSVDAHTYEPLTIMQRAVDSPLAAFAVKGVNSFDAGIPGVLTGARGRGTLEAMDAAYPTASALGDLVGTTAGTFALGSGLGKVATKVAAPTVAKLLANPLTADVAFGSTYGATQSQNPWEGAVIGALTALGGHAVGGQIAKRVPRLFGVALPSDPLGRGERAVFDAAQKTGRDEVSAALAQADQLGVPATIADVSPEVNSLTGAALRRSPAAAGEARDMLLTRGRGQYDRFQGAIERDLGPVENIPQRSEDLIAQAKAAAAPLYDQAYANGGAPVFHGEVKDLVERPSMQSALGKARTIAAEEGRDPNTLGLVLDKDGLLVKVDKPTWQTFDYVKRGLDDVLEGYRDPTTGRLNLDTQGRAINNTRADFLARFDKANPDYATARAAYAGPAAERDALAMGQRAASMSPDQLSVNVGRATPTQADQMRLGFQSQLAENGGRLRYNTNPFESVLGTPAMEQRLRTMYPDSPDRVARLLAQRDIERQAAASSNRLVGNSMTAERQVADNAFDNSGLAGDLAQGAAETMAYGAPYMTVAKSLLGRGVGRAIRDYRALGLGNRAVQLADQIAPVALENDPAKASAMLDDMAQQDAAYQATVAQLLAQAVPRGGHVGSAVSSDIAAELMR